MGDNIKAVVKSADDIKVFLSHKELLGSWQQNADKFEAGSAVSGIVRSVEDYGIFVELTPNLTGLAEPKEGITPGMAVSVYIKSLIPEKMKIKLIIVDSFVSSGAPPTNEYFIDSGHIDIFKYSPESSGKNIETRF